jgi:hypothetical protein
MIIPVIIGATKYAGEFQELGVGARVCAMGGSGVAQFTDPSVIYFNPAGSFYNLRGVMLMHAENFAGAVKNDYGAVILPQGSIVLGVGVQYVSVSDIKFTTLPDTNSLPGVENQPIPYDTVGTKDFVFYINGAKGNDRFSYGANIKIFYRDLAVMTGYGGGLDLGLMINADYLKVGVSIRDFVLSPLIWDNGSRETILPRLSVGVAPVIPIEKISSVITLACDINKFLDIEGFGLNLGFEYAYKDLVFGRFGRNDGRYTLGMGLLYKKFWLDYALVTHSSLASSNKFSAGLRF